MHHGPTRSTSRPIAGSAPVVVLLGLAAGAGTFLALPRPAPTPASRSDVAAPPEPPSAELGSASSSASLAPTGVAPFEASEPAEPTLAEQRAALLARMKRALLLDDAQMAAVTRVFEASPQLGQGNPAVSRHPMTRAECVAARRGAGVSDPDVPRCGAPAMVPVYDPSAGAAESARVCIDRFEFPNVACDYPVVNVRSVEAAELCHAVGKRLCDAHEWEGACAGALRAPESEYLWPRDRMQASYAHNQAREKTWAYGPERDFSRCATGSHVTRDCPGGGWELCGSNTYPAGAFPSCVSAFGVYDQHGNAAEHMSLPRTPAELGGKGETEMKGSWFVFATTPAHEDDCRWRAPAWHATPVDAVSSHRNYHLGFRCCRDIDAP